MKKLVSVLVAGVFGLSAAAGFAADVKPVETTKAAATAAVQAANPAPAVKKEATKHVEKAEKKVEANVGAAKPEVKPTAAGKVERKLDSVEKKTDAVKAAVKP